MEFDGDYALVTKVNAGESLQLTFRLKQYETIEHAAGAEYRVQWKGSWVTGLTPRGSRVPLYTKRGAIATSHASLCQPRYPE